MLDMNDSEATMRCDVGVYVCSDDDDVMIRNSMSREKIGSPVEQLSSKLKERKCWLVDCGWLALEKLGDE